MNNWLELQEQIEDAFRKQFDSAVYGAKRNRALVATANTDSSETSVVSCDDPSERWEILDKVWLGAVSDARDQYLTWKMSSAEFVH